MMDKDWVHLNMQLQMASQIPAVVQNENLTIHRGKGGGVKADVPKPAKTGLQERKALRDLSNVGKLRLLGVPKASALKEKSAVHGRGTTKNTPKSSFLTDEEIKRCNEWAKEGTEKAHFTGNDSQKLQKEQQEERIRKEVDKVMSALREWTNMAYDLGMPTKRVDKYTDDITKLELVPEVLPSTTSLRSNSAVEEMEDLLLEPELDPFAFLDAFEFKLKEDYDSI